MAAHRTTAPSGAPEHSHHRVKLSVYLLFGLIGAYFVGLGVAKEAYGAAIVGVGVLVGCAFALRATWADH